MDRYRFSIKSDGSPDFKQIREDLGLVYMGLSAAYEEGAERADAERLYNMAKDRLIILTEGIAKNPPNRSKINVR